MRGRKFYLNRRNGKVMGVCAGISDYTGVDVTWVRVAMVLLTLAAFPWPPIAYLALGLIGSQRPAGLFDAEDAAPPARTVRTSTAQVREEMRDIDRRLLEVDSFVSHSNAKLAQDIEQLR